MKCSVTCLTQTTHTLTLYPSVRTALLQCSSAVNVVHQNTLTIWSRCDWKYFLLTPLNGGTRSLLLGCHWTIGRGHWWFWIARKRRRFVRTSVTGTWAITIPLSLYTITIPLVTTITIPLSLYTITIPAITTITRSHWSLMVPSPSHYQLVDTILSCSSSQPSAPITGGRGGIWVCLNMVVVTLKKKGKWVDVWVNVSEWESEWMSECEWENDSECSPWRQAEELFQDLWALTHNEVQ